MAAGGLSVSKCSTLAQPQSFSSITSKPVQATASSHIVRTATTLALPAISFPSQQQACKKVPNLQKTEDCLPVEVLRQSIFPKLTVNQVACESFHLPPSQLSPLAEEFSPHELYPPGVDRFGRPIITENTAEMLLDYFEDVPEAPDVSLPPATPDIENVKKLGNRSVKLAGGGEFLDRILPPLTAPFSCNEDFPPAHFFDLHKMVKQAGTYNYAGARIQLKHSKLNIDKFRELLVDYDDMEILQYIEFGFPLGLSQQFQLTSCTQNHSSAYEYYSFLDEFMSKEISLTGITGPVSTPPFDSTKVSPLMTAVKKPGSRRPVFDASHGDYSVNNNTPEKEYLGGEYQFSFPTVLDLAQIVVKLGKGCLLWKRDLSRWFMQLPTDPCDYDKLGVIWRGLWFVFVSYVWGCRHAGYNAQRVSRAILHILKNLALSSTSEVYNTLVYMDDFAGAEIGDKAWHAFNDLGTLLSDLGVVESTKKALPPSTRMLFLGVEFDTEKMIMRVGDEKRSEVKNTVGRWYRRTVATKEELQSLQGQLMWVSKVVRFSRIFVARIISEQKSLKSQKQKKSLSDEVKKDLLWWKMFLDVFNGVELIIPQTVSCNILGDATLSGAGAWNEDFQEFWSRKFPWHMQSADFPIHQKEFLTVIIEVKVWGASWSGKRVAIHCDNVSVVETISNLKPKNLELQRLLREFLYYVITFKFEPVMVRIPTKDNHFADFVSRNHITEDIKNEFAKFGLTKMEPILVPDQMFDFLADW